MTSAPASDLRRDSLICCGLLVVTLALFWPVHRHDFVNYDDPEVVTENPQVQAGLTWHGLTWALSSYHFANWVPLVWLSHMLDVQLFGLNPGGHHLTSLSLHIASTVLLFLTLKRLTRAHWRSAFVAALFALHPLHVESVAWIAERRDVLSTFFGMLTLLMYERYVEGYKVQTPKTKVFYWLALACFALGLMSKAMIVTLPVVMLLLDYWPLQRFQLHVPPWRRSATHSLPGRGWAQADQLSTLWRLIREKLPFLAAGCLSGVVTLCAQSQAGALPSVARLPIPDRLLNATLSYARYLLQMLWPRGLTVFYPYPKSLSIWPAAGAGLLILVISVAALSLVRRRPYFAVGWFWYLATLLPVAGLIQTGAHAHADRYTYLPLIGVFIMLAWGAADLFPHSRTGRSALALGAALVLGACVGATRSQLKHWQNSVTLFSHALEVTKDNWLAHNNLGTALADQGKVDEGAEHFRAVLQINPDCDDARNNLGRFLAERGKPDEARAQIEAVLRRDPRHARAHRNLGYVLFAEGNIAQGVAQYALARQLRPEDAVTPEDLAAALTRQADSRTPLPCLRQALDLLPTADLRAQVAAAWAGQGEVQCAVQGYRAALALKPQSPEILNNLVWILATCPEANLRDGAEAVRFGERACELTRFQRTLMVGTLAAAYAEAGRFAEAVATAEKACALAAASGDDALAGKNRELLQLYRAGRPYREPANPAPVGPAAPKP